MERISLGEVLGKPQAVAEKEMARESLIFDFTNSIWGRMVELGVDESSLAKLLGKSVYQVKRALNGECLTLNLVADMAFVLESHFIIDIKEGRYSDEGVGIGDVVLSKYGQLCVSPDVGQIKLERAVYRELLPIVTCSFILQRISRLSDLSKVIGIPKGRLSRIFKSDEEFAVELLSDIAYALNFEVVVNIVNGQYRMR